MIRYHHETDNLQCLTMFMSGYVICIFGQGKLS